MKNKQETIALSEFEKVTRYIKTLREERQNLLAKLGKSTKIDNIEGQIVAYEDMAQTLRKIIEAGWEAQNGKH